MENQASAKPNLAAELKVHRIYTKSSSFEAANVTVPEITVAQPVIDLQIHANVYPQSPTDNTHEVVLTLQVTAKHNGALLWQVQLQQAGRML